MNQKNIAIIGAGTWGETHASIFKEYKNINLVAVSDINTRRAEVFADKFDIPHYYSDYKDMLSEIDIDAVSIVTPDFTHRDPVVECAMAGKDILLEKPLATTRTDVEDILRAVKENNVRLMVDLHNRWSPPFASAKETVDRGEIGKPVSAYFRLNDIKWVATDLLSWAEKSSILWFLGSHTIDTLRWIFGDEIRKVYAVSHTGVLKEMGINTEDVFQTIIEFRNGGIATIENSWIIPDTHPCVNDIKFNITGSKGIINIDASNNRLLEKYTDNTHINPDILVKHYIHGKAKGFAYDSIKHFVECLQTGDDFLVSVEDAANTSLVILAIMESARTGNPVNVEYMEELM